jgi:hypothetical protein
MSDGRDRVEIAGVQTPAEAKAGERRAYLSVHFACCQVFQRIYRSADGKAYRGRCPRCLRTIEFVVGDGGSESRTFVVH